ncbi:MFS transporter, FHS family, L-fucose permease [Xylanibacter ruminicola]|uniref:MFS transporter, FHS family, L-fucose permease n=1 Tax=Xylanibacter ruminicola TaxID=839 RepID=A0A1H5WYW8_XYLRU|nr:MFS transporter [Xylanibacter ruminicola]SEG04724.1 MFS transporter, FHS family, L-fucose permease [Xylanibacter ruminicola]
MELNKNSLFRANGTNYLVPFVLITTLFFLWGFARAILDVLNKHFQNEMHISITESSLIQVTTYMGYFLMAIPAGLFINYMGYRRGVVFGLLLFGIGSLLFVPCTEAGTLGAFLFALFVISVGLVFLETAANPYVTELGDKETASSRLNLSQSFNGLGCLFATFAVGQFLFSDDSNGNVAVPYVILGIVVLLIAAVFSMVSLPEIVHHDGLEQKARYGREPLLKVWKHKYFVYGLIALLSYEVAEISINSYFINYVTGMGWMDDRTASIVLTGALAFFMVGRFGGSLIMRRLPAEMMLFLCGAGCVACIMLVLMNFGRWSMIGLIGNYLFEAVMFPTIFSLAVRGLGSLTKSASSILMMTPVGGCGFLLVGIIADATDMVVPFIIPLLCYVIVALYGFGLVVSRARKLRS